MPRASKIAMTIVLVTGAASLQPSSRVMASSSSDANAAADKSAQHASLKPASATAADIPFRDYDSAAEQVLLDLANHARAQADAPPLTFDNGLSQAARIHAEAMFAARQLSHQFTGEPSLPQRLATATRLQLDQEGENVAFDFDAASGHQHLMLSPPHRANLLNPAYNVVGMGVIRSGDRLYIVQDFGHALPNYSAAEVKERIAAAVIQARQQARQPALARRDLSRRDLSGHDLSIHDVSSRDVSSYAPSGNGQSFADDAACSMAQADKLGTSPVQQLAQRYTVLTYTSLHPETLPAEAGRVLDDRNLRTFSIGTCYARTNTYPTGVYWV
ncbi:MAG: CAP domain-containing protein, partial [Candidatus Sulfotelmatobacter sp.]